LTFDRLEAGPDLAEGRALDVDEGLGVGVGGNDCVVAACGVDVGTEPMPDELSELQMIDQAANTAHVEKPAPSSIVAARSQRRGDDF
jgi:hypothetical protein